MFALEEIKAMNEAEDKKVNVQIEQIKNTYMIFFDMYMHALITKKKLETITNMVNIDLERLGSDFRY